MWRCVLFILLASHGAEAAEFRVSPQGVSLDELFASGELSGGDTIVLEPGRYGSISIQGVDFDPPVTVQSKTGNATIEALTINDVSGLEVRALRVRPRAGSDPLVDLIDVERVGLWDLDVASGSQPSDWTKQQWLERARSGIRVSGRNVQIVRAQIAGVDHGIVAIADGVSVRDSVIRWFRGDGIRALGHHGTFVGNRIENCVDVDDNHDDAIQSWSVGLDGTPGHGVVEHLRITGNVIREGNAGPLTCSLQGIGLFDGFFDDIEVAGNLVEVNHWHGITIMGARRGVIQGNVVVDSNPNARGVPWISVTAHKDGRQSEDVRIEGNVVQIGSWSTQARFSQPQPGVLVTDNREVETAKRGLAAWERASR